MLKILLIKIKTKSYSWLVLFVTTFSSCNSDGEPSIYLIPENFNGRVTIILNSPNGHPEKYEDDFRIFEIDKNGCYRSQFEPQYDKWSVEKFFLVDSLGNRTKIQTSSGFKTYEQDTTNLKRVFHIISGDFAPENPNLHFYSFLICKSSEYENMIKLMNKEHDKCLLSD